MAKFKDIDFATLNVAQVIERGQRLDLAIDKLEAQLYGLCVIDGARRRSVIMARIEPLCLLLLKNENEEARRVRRYEVVG